MASTLNYYFQIQGLLNGQDIEFPPGGAGLYAPNSLATTADIKLLRDITIADTTVTKLLDVGAGLDLDSATYFAILPSVATNITMVGSVDANNGGFLCNAGKPFIIPSGKLLPYNAVSATANAGAAEAITAIYGYQSSGGNGKVYILGIG